MTSRQSLLNHFSLTLRIEASATDDEAWTAIEERVTEYSRKSSPAAALAIRWNRYLDTLETYEGKRAMRRFLAAVRRGS